MITSTSSSGFGPAATQFFEDLEDQHTREFWLAHKDVFEREVREPTAALLDSLPEDQPFKLWDVPLCMARMPCTAGTNRVQLGVWAS
jgi:hypothetical protein